jgi:glyoxylase-like metal-dependent hydrolase (beta-lactamase superfamily II)
MRHENFLPPHDPHDGPSPLDLFVWVAVSKDRIVLIDSGADENTVRTRGYQFIRSPTVALAALGIEADAVTDLVVTHLHWDHAGNFDKFPRARLWAHGAETAYATGPSMAQPFLRRPFDVDHVCSLVRALYAGRVEFNDGDRQIAPGISVHHVGGHTPGLQVVRVNTSRGAVVVASDALHLYENWTRGVPFPVVVRADEYLAAFRTIERLADSPDHVIAGHDPAVLELYPRVHGPAETFAVRLDVPPRSK